MSQIKVPVILIPELGEQGLLPDGGIINAGGIAGPHFTVSGKPLIFADGTATDGSGQVIVTNTTTQTNVLAYEHEQLTPAATWVVAHSKNTRKIHITIWDSDGEAILADTIRIVDFNTVHVLFNTAITGRAVLMMF